jgi:hypothetical protein
MSKFIELFFDYNNTTNLKVTTIARTIFTLMHRFPYVYFASPLDRTPQWYFILQILSTIGKEIMQLHDCLMHPTTNYYVRSMRWARFWYLKDLGGCSCIITLDWVDYFCKPMLLPIRVKIHEKVMDETKVQLSKCYLPRNIFYPSNEFF